LADETPYPRAPWHEGPDEDAPASSWLALDDDEVLQRIETLDPAIDADAQLLEVVHSARHFFIRQEAAKRVRDRRKLFAFENDRHVGQILVRHLTRREDLTYLEKLASGSHHAEVRTAAQVQLAQLWARLKRPRPEKRAPAVPSVSGIRPHEAARSGVDSSLLGWAVHFIVERVWSALGTERTAILLRKTRQELREAHPILGRFKLDASAQVAFELAAGSSKLQPDAVRAVAAWMAAFLAAARQEKGELRQASVREVTRLMADALQEAGFYSAFEEAERGGGG
jgi:hypothetical protein